MLCHLYVKTINIEYTHKIYDPKPSLEVLQKNIPVVHKKLEV